MRTRPIIGALSAALACLALPKYAATAASKTTTPKPEPVAANEITPKEMAAAVRTAALPLATNLGVTMGDPICPSGAKRKDTLAAQCTVPFDRVPVPYIVTNPGGALAATPLFLVVARTKLELQLGDGARCGKEPVIVVPSGGAINCTSSKGAIGAVVTGTQASWTARAASASKAPATVQETTTKAKRKKR